MEWIRGVNHIRQPHLKNLVSPEDTTAPRSSYGEGILYKDGRDEPRPYRCWRTTTFLPHRVIKARGVF